MGKRSVILRKAKKEKGHDVRIEIGNEAFDFVIFSGEGIGNIHEKLKKMCRTDNLSWYFKIAKGERERERREKT
jgi:hypothetical protein